MGAAPSGAAAARHRHLGGCIPEHGHQLRRCDHVVRISTILLHQEANALEGPHTEMLEWYSRGGPPGGFACIDTNRSGTLEKDEILKAAAGNDAALVDFISQIPSLHVLLQP